MYPCWSHDMEMMQLPLYPSTSPTISLTTTPNCGVWFILLAMVSIYLFLSICLIDFTLFISETLHCIFLNHLPPRQNNQWYILTWLHAIHPHALWIVLQIFNMSFFLSATFCVNIYKRLVSLLVIFVPNGLEVYDIWDLDIIELNIIPYCCSIDYAWVTHETLDSRANRMWYCLQYENNQQQWAVSAFFRSSS